VDSASRSFKISTTAQGSIATHLHHQKGLLSDSRLQKSLKRKTMRRRLVRVSLVSANVLILAIVAGLVFTSSHSNSTITTSNVVSSSAAAAPVDGQTSYDIAANVARMTNLPESTAISNQAQSAQVAVAVSASNNSIVAKPQIVATALKSRNDIQSYVAQAGDTIQSIAQKFGITSNSLMWSNGITGTSVALGTKLQIPPVNGIVYTVKTGDTVAGLAARYSANADQIVAFNDAEITGITSGEQILVPNGQVATVVATNSFGGGTSGLISGSFTPVYGSNGYDPGWCTYYAAAMAHVPSNWGNASTWAYYARLSGWTVSTTPVPGAVVQTSRGDHVGYVEQVSSDGSQIIYSDMNGLRGFNEVGTSGWVSAANGFDGGRFDDVVYIYR
jgi:LysM repeat protein